MIGGPRSREPLIPPGYTDLSRRAHAQQTLHNTPFKDYRNKTQPHDGRTHKLESAALPIRESLSVRLRHDHRQTPHQLINCAVAHYRYNKYNLITLRERKRSVNTPWAQQSS